MRTDPGEVRERGDKGERIGSREKCGGGQRGRGKSGGVKWKTKLMDRDE